MTDIKTDTGPAPGMITLAALDRLSSVRHGFFTREGGYSEGGFAALNCGLNSGDELDRVQANRSLAMSRLDLTIERLAAVRQVHSARVVVVNEDWPPSQWPEADALVTRRRGVALGVLGADCAPVLIADDQAGVIAAAHAGWRGALSGVIDHTVAAMCKLGAAPERMVAGIGPCIAQWSYQVGNDFPAAFIAADPGNAVFFAAEPDGLHWRFDLPGFIARRLALASVSQISRTPCDTFRDQDRFFSHRRSQLSGEAACGRQISAIALEP